MPLAVTGDSCRNLSLRLDTLLRSHIHPVSCLRPFSRWSALCKVEKGLLFSSLRFKICNYYY